MMSVRNRNSAQPTGKTFQAIGIVVKRDNPVAVRLAKRIALWFMDHSKDVYLDKVPGLAGDKRLKGPRIRHCTRNAMVKYADCVIVLGGDGTLIRMAREVLYVNRHVPLIGVNLGSLGFLTKVGRGNIERLMRDLLMGRYHEDVRSCLEVVVKKHGRGRGSEQRFYVLNDVVLNKAGLARMVLVEIAIDGNHVATFRSDGVIIATPTGSTAYSLAAGGPIVSPRVATTVITPICPQFLGHQSLVISDDSVIELTLGKRNPERIYLSLDGQMGQEITRDHSITIRKADRSVSLIALKSWDFFETLRKKLKWTVQNNAQGIES